MILKGKTALVTGSTSGIGLGIAQCLARQGANIVLNGFGDVEGPKAAVTALGAKVAYHGADMSKPAEIEAMMAFAEATFGGVDVLVNNAGIQHVAQIEDFPVERWDAIIAINLSSAFHTTRLALPGMRTRNWGRVINIASVHGLVASAAKSAYVASKHGQAGMTDALRQELRGTGVRITAIYPPNIEDISPLNISEWNGVREPTSWLTNKDVAGTIIGSLSRARHVHFMSVLLETATSNFHGH